MSANANGNLSKNNGSAENERERIRELLRYDILDTPDEDEFDDITKVATYLCDVDCAQINFLDYDRQWSKSCYGWDLKEIPRNESICTYTIQQDKYMVINDVSKDPRFKDYDYVKEKKVQFYAGIVLKSTHGYNIGTLCVFDKEPRELDDEQLESLHILGKDVESKLELRLKREQLIDEHNKLKKTATFLHNSADLMLILKPGSLEIEEVNDEVEQLLGYKQDDIVGTRLTDYLQTGEFEKELKDWRENQTKKQFSSETTFKTRKDGLLWLQLSITEKNDKYFTTGRNITPRKRVEQRLLEQKKFTENIINHLPGIFFLADEEGRIQQWNNNLGKTDKRTNEEIRGQSYKKFIAEKDHLAASEALREAFENGYSHTEISFVSANGKVTPLLLEGFRYLDKNDAYVVGIGVDITEEKQALEELEQKEKKLKEAQRIGRMGSWTWHILTNEITWSEEVYDLLDLDKEKFTPTIENFSEMLPEEDQQKVEKIIEKIMAGEDWQEVELQLNKPDGTKLYVNERGEVHYDSDGNPVEVSGTMQDVTERRKAEEQIKEALKEKEVLLAEVHHRVKNNLAIINSLIQLEIYNLEDEQLKKVLSESQMRIKSMALIHETLYSSGDFGGISFKKYLEQLIHTVSETYSSKIQHIDVELKVEELSLNINQAIPCALMLNELFTNSMKHAFPDSEKGTIRLEMKERQGLVHLCIKDNGVGLAPEVNPADPATLGLTLVNTLIDQLQGDLSINTENGTTINISFEKNKGKGSGANVFFPSGS